MRLVGQRVLRVDRGQGHELRDRTGGGERAHLPRDLAPVGPVDAALAPGADNDAERDPVDHVGSTRRIRARVGQLDRERHRLVRDHRRL